MSILKCIHIFLISLYPYPTSFSLGWKKLILEFCTEVGRRNPSKEATPFCSINEKIVRLLTSLRKEARVILIWLRCKSSLWAVCCWFNWKVGNWTICFWRQISSSGNKLPALCWCLLADIMLLYLWIERWWFPKHFRLIYLLPFDMVLSKVILFCLINAKSW